MAVLCHQRASFQNSETAVRLFAVFQLGCTCLQLHPAFRGTKGNNKGNNLACAAHERVPNRSLAGRIRVRPEYSRSLGQLEERVLMMEGGRTEKSSRLWMQKYCKSL